MDKRALAVVGVLVVSFAVLCPALVLAQEHNHWLMNLVREADQAKQRYEAAQREYDQATRQHAERDRARQAMDDAELEYHQRSEQLDDARVRRLAHESGLTEDEVRAMRAEKKGWGRIAKELDVHPGILGHGPYNEPGSGDSADVEGDPGRDRAATKKVRPQQGRFKQAKRKSKPRGKSRSRKTGGKGRGKGKGKK